MSGRSLILRLHRRPVTTGILVALAGILFLVALQALMRPYATEGLYFQGWSSERLMQTVSLDDLRAHPFQTLTHIHIQPPLLDALRALLVRFTPPGDSVAALHSVDLMLYQLWAVLYGVFGALIFWWVARFRNPKVGIAAAAVFLLHPATIFYATLLDTTLMTAFLIAVLYYLLWKVRRGERVPAWLLALSVLSLLFTKPIFQWPFLFVMIATLLLLGLDRRRLVAFTLIVGGVFGLYIGKQHHQFGLWMTSSFTGLNLTRSAGIDETEHFLTFLDETATPEGPTAGTPAVLTRKHQLTGVPNYNHADYLRLNRELIAEYRAYLATTPIRELALSYLDNLRIYFRPSSIYTPHQIVDRLPWRSVFDRIFSFPALVVLLVFSWWTWITGANDRADRAGRIGLLIPGIFIFLVTILFEKGENMRFKYFLEPVMLVFITSQLHAVRRLVLTGWIVKRVGGDARWGIRRGPRNGAPGRSP